MPATANIIGKAANGIADDIISTSVLSYSSPIVFVPSMNEVMWFNKVVQQNVSKLLSLGHHVVTPSTGYEVSNLQWTFGAMADLAVVENRLREIIGIQTTG